jgi:pimeloyl-ACP methyl ester carboxylesterase
MDWRQASHTGGLPNHVCRSGTWIQQISEQTKNQLSNWGLTDPSKIKLVGHSMGTILSTEIGLRYNSQVSQSILLDPPSDPCPGAYNVNDPAGPFNETKKSDLDKSSLNNRALVGANSLAGNQEHARTAQKSFQINFGSSTTNDSEHGWVQETFKNMINQTQSPTDRLQGDILGTRDNSKHETWERDGWGAFGWQNHNGIIYTVKKEAGVPLIRKADPMNAGDVVKLEYKEFGRKFEILKN